MADYFRNTPDSINKALVILWEGLVKNEIDIEVSAAVSYCLDETFENKISTKNF